MKKRVFVSLFLLTIILTSFLVLVEGTPKESTDTNTKTQETPQTSKEESKKIENPFNDPIPLPQTVQKPIKRLLGLNPEERLNFSKFIVLIALFILIFLIIQNLLSMIPFFETSIKKLTGTIILTLLISITGAIKKGLVFWQALADVFKIPEKIGIFWTGFGIVFILVLFIILRYFTETLKQSGKLVQARTEGRKIGYMQAMAKIQAKNLK